MEINGQASWRPSLYWFAKDIKISHSIFALPFAASSFLFFPEYTDSNLAGPVWQAHISWLLVLQLVICMVCARSFAMGANRYLDRHIDAKNHRTVSRMIPAQRLSANSALVWTLLFGLSFVLVSFSINSLAGYCSIPLLLILAVYSLMKRISWLTHFYLGVCLGLAPVAVEIAVLGSASLPVLLVGLAVTLWTAGFDILYSLQDIHFDKQHALKSIPARFGPRKALYISQMSFAGMVIALSLAGYLTSKQSWYFGGVLAIAGILIWEHYLVRDAHHDGSSKNINAAFFNVNAWVSVLFFFFTFLDVGYRLWF